MSLPHRRAVRSRRAVRRGAVRHRAASLATAGVVALSLPLAIPSGVARAATDDQVNTAIDEGIAYLLGEVTKNPQDPESGHAVGQTALETYALVVAGVSIQHPVIRKNFDFLRKNALRARHTYTLACYLFALDAAISQIENDLLMLKSRRVRERFRDDPRIGRPYREQIQRTIDLLISNQNQAGSWRYNAPRGGDSDFDNSNVQFAVLGLGIGAKRNVPIPPEVWRGVVDHFLKWQEKDGPEVEGRLEMNEAMRRGRDRVKLVSTDDRRGEGTKRGDDDTEAGRTVVEQPENPELGTEKLEVFARGWAYQNDNNYRWNMTCAGLSSLILARESLRGQLSGDVLADLNKAIRDGFGWTMKHWTPTKSYYGAYSLEKVADLGGVAKFDGHDWYRELADWLVGEQEANGSWPGGKTHGELRRVATSFGLLILNRASSLLTMAPGSRIVVSGQSGAEAGGVGDRNWVYVPDLDVTMHYPTLMRTIRLRPSQQLVDFLQNIVDNYSVEWKGELVPAMVEIRDQVPSRAVHKIIQGYLEDITGATYKDESKYLVWFRRWERVMAIGRRQSEDHIPDLLEYYENTQESFVLKKAIAWALQRCKAREALPLFLADLESRDERVRAMAYFYFRQFFIDSPPPFDAGASSRERGEQVARIREWFERQ